MELEIKHLSPYLPYGLKLQYIVRDEVKKIGIMQSISHNEDEAHPTRISISQMYNEEHIWMFKPILHPLSSLTEQELIDNVIETHIDYLIDGFDVLDVPYRVFEYLVSKHYDVFKLIQQELAIDYNTLNNK